MADEMNWHKLYLNSLVCTSLSFCHTSSPYVNIPQCMEYTLLKRLPLRLMIKLLTQEMWSPATTQKVNSYTEGKDWIPLIRWGINHSSPLVGKCHIWHPALHIQQFLSVPPRSSICSCQDASWDHQRDPA